MSVICAGAGGGGSLPRLPSEAQRPPGDSDSLPAASGTTRVPVSHRPAARRRVSPPNSLSTGGLADTARNTLLSARTQVVDFEAAVIQIGCLKRSGTVCGQRFGHPGATQTRSPRLLLGVDFDSSLR